MRSTAIEFVFLRVVMLSITIFFLAGCGDSCSDLNDPIENALSDDNVISQLEYGIIREELTENKGKYGKCYPRLWEGENIVDQELIAYIVSTNEYVRNSLKYGSNPEILTKATDQLSTVSVNPKVITPILYLERSGSMEAYDKAQGSGQFKASLVKLLNEFSLLQPEKSLVYIVNDNIYDFQDSFVDFIRLSDMFRSSQGIGDSRFTDFDKIFRTLLDSTKTGELSFFVSDLIYSTSNSGIKNPIRIQSEINGLMTNIFNNVVDDNSLLIVKFSGDYIGTYYPFNNISFQYNGLRPYYLCIVSENATIQDFLSNPKYERVRSFENYPFFENFFFFQKRTDTPANATIVLNDPSNMGRFRQSSDEIKFRKTFISELEAVKQDPISKELHISIAVDFSQFILSESYITNPNNYYVKAKDPFRIVDIQPLIGLTGYTHKIVVGTSSFRYKEQDLSISLRILFPEWMNMSSTLDDRDYGVSSFSETTFAFEGMMRGVYEAYYKNEDQNYFTIGLKLKN